jgi:hypothetical protein
MGLLRNDEEKFYQSQLVEVKSCREILKTLDSEGKLEGMPFMPEMVSFCGKRIRVHRRADRTCVAGQGFHRMTGTVFLHESRCDGSHHDGCQRGCLLFWKEAWLKPARGAPRVIKDAPADRNAARALKNLATRQGDRYMCQSTELASATVGALSRWDVRPWLREVFRGELTMTGFLAIVRRALFNRFIRPGQSHSLAGTEGKKSRGDLALREGEWVRVKRADELQGQLDQKNTNLGLAFQPTMHAAIGERFQVAYPIHRIIIEQTGKMVQLRNTVVLKGVTCQGPCAANCPRSEHLFWRESWLDRTGEKEVPAEEVVRYF